MIPGSHRESNSRFDGPIFLVESREGREKKERRARKIVEEGEDKIGPVLGGNSKGEGVYRFFCWLVPRKKKGEGVVEIEGKKEGRKGRNFSCPALDKGKIISVSSIT